MVSMTMHDALGGEGLGPMGEGGEGSGGGEGGEGGEGGSAQLFWTSVKLATAPGSRY